MPNLKHHLCQVGSTPEEECSCHVTRQLPQEENSSSWGGGGEKGTLVCTPFQDCILQPLVQLQFGRWPSTRFLQEAGRWSCSGIKADLLHCLCEEIHCHFLASFTQTLPKMLPYPEPNTAQWERLVANRTWEKLFVQNLNNILCQNKCDNGLLCLAP